MKKLHRALYLTPIKNYTKIKQKLIAVKNRLMLKTGLYGLDADFLSIVLLVFSIILCAAFVMPFSDFPKRIFPQIRFRQRSATGASKASLSPYR